MPQQTMVPYLSDRRKTLLISRRVAQRSGYMPASGAAWLQRLYIRSGRLVLLLLRG